MPARPRLPRPRETGCRLARDPCPWIRTRKRKVAFRPIEFIDFGELAHVVLLRFNSSMVPGSVLRFSAF